MPGNAAAVIVAERHGAEVARWAGALDWQGPMPVELIGERDGTSWAWQPHEPTELRIQAHLERKGGVEVTAWAERSHATRMRILIVPALDAPGGANEQGHAGRPRHPDARVDALPDAAPDADAAAPADTAPDADAAAPADTAPAAAASGGAGHHGDGTGMSPEHGRRDGHTAGSRDPSWHDNPRAELVTHGAGRTPADHGKEGGSAGGEPGGDGNTFGLGLFGGLFDAPESVAPLVGAGLILADANFTHFGQKFLSRVVRGMGARALGKEMKREATHVVAREMTKVEGTLARSPVYRSLPVRERSTLLARTEHAMTRAYYKKAQAHFTQAAERNAAHAAVYRAQKDRMSRRFATLSLENEAAYRDMARAARETLDELEKTARAQESAARKAARTANKEAERAAKKLQEAKRLARARGPLKGKGGLRWLSTSRIEFEGMEVRAVRDLSHMNESELRLMARSGTAAKDRAGETLEVHHHLQDPDGPFIEIAGTKHQVRNPRQHPKGNRKGDGLTDAERRAFNVWRKRYWKARARDELSKRGAEP